MEKKKKKIQNTMQGFVWEFMEPMAKIFFPFECVQIQTVCCCHARVGITNLGEISWSRSPGEPQDEAEIGSSLRGDHHQGKEALLNVGQWLPLVPCYQCIVNDFVPTSLFDCLYSLCLWMSVIFVQTWVSFSYFVSNLLAFYYKLIVLISFNLTNLLDFALDLLAFFHFVEFKLLLANYGNLYNWSELHAYNFWAHKRKNKRNWKW